MLFLIAHAALLSNRVIVSKFDTPNCESSKAVDVNALEENVCFTPFPVFPSISVTVRCFNSTLSIQQCDGSTLGAGLEVAYPDDGGLCVTAGSASTLYKCVAPLCFSESATACRVERGREGDAEGALRACLEEEGGASTAPVARRTKMSDLAAGDLVLGGGGGGAGEDFAVSAVPVVFNQHVAEGTTTLSPTLLRIVHSCGKRSGELVLTPDHVLWARGALRAASEVRKGDLLRATCAASRAAGAPSASAPVATEEATVLAVETLMGDRRVVNPLTTSGTILAGGSTGSFALASTYPSWIAAPLLASPFSFFPFSAYVAHLFPSSTQRAYDLYIEPYSASLVRTVSATPILASATTAAVASATADVAAVLPLLAHAFGSALSSLLGREH